MVQGELRRTTHPVGEKRPNAWGLNDMHGNVEEWCWNWHESYEGRRDIRQQDPIGPSEGEGRVTRGGSWRTMESACGSSSWNAIRPTFRVSYLGFRCARSA